MAGLLRRGLLAALVSALAAPAPAQFAPAGDNDDQAVITGCVRSTLDNDNPRGLLVWSKGNVFVGAPDVRLRTSETGGIPLGTTGAHHMIFYWIDDEEDFAMHAGKRVEIVGELSDELDTAELEIDANSTVTEIEFEYDGQDVKAQIPTTWLLPEADFETDVAVRRVDVEKVTVLGSCAVN